MIRINKLTAAKAAVVLSVIPVLIYANAGGPQSGYTGSPNEGGTCITCHTASLGGPGNVKVDFPSGLAYVPGVTQHLVVTVTDSGKKRWGFQLTARAVSDVAKMAGSFTAGSDGNTQVICLDRAGTETVGPCTSVSQRQYVEHTLTEARKDQKGSFAFNFDWTPPATDYGAVNIHVAAIAADGDITAAGDYTYTASYTLSSPQSILPAISKTVNAASYQNALAPGAWTSIMGVNLAGNTRWWRAGEIVNDALPTQLDGVSVTIGGQPAYIGFISPTQLNVLAPSDIGVGPVYVQVTNHNGVPTDWFIAQLQPVAPAFFQWVRSYSVATRPDYSLVAPSALFAPQGSSTPAKVGDVVILWGTGFGQTSPPFPNGKQVPGDQLYSVVNTPVILLGTVPAKVLGAALSPGSAGLYQIAIEVPPVPYIGDYLLTAQAAGVTSAPVLFNVQK
jgi:uncharacterized protein (TIGR03437 family)